MEELKVYKFRNTTNAFNYVFEKELVANETIILQMPVVSPNKRGINDIAWQSDGNVTLYGTLSANPKKEDTIWQEICEDYDINKCTSALKIVCGEAPCRFIARALLN